MELVGASQPSRYRDRHGRDMKDIDEAVEELPLADDSNASRLDRLAGVELSCQQRVKRLVAFEDEVRVDERTLCRPPTLRVRTSWSGAPSDPLRGQRWDLRGRHHPRRRRDRRRLSRYRAAALVAQENSRARRVTSSSTSHCVPARSRRHAEAAQEREEVSAYERISGPAAHYNTDLGENAWIRGLSRRPRSMLPADRRITQLPKRSQRLPGVAT
jgi:hypothetical protein